MPNPDQEIEKHLDAGLKRATSYYRRYHLWDVLLIFFSLIGGAMSALFAGQLGITSESILSADWATACFDISIISSVSVLAGALHKGLHIPDHAQSAASCKAKLSGLKVALTFEKKDPAEIASMYREVLSEHADSLV